MLARLRDSREVERSSLMLCARLPKPSLLLPLLLLLLLSDPEPPLCCDGVFSLLSVPLLHLRSSDPYQDTFMLAASCKSLITACVRRQLSAASLRITGPCSEECKGCWVCMCESGLGSPTSATG